MYRTTLSICCLNIVMTLCMTLSGCSEREFDWVSNSPLSFYAKNHNENTEWPSSPDSLKILAIGNSFTDNSMDLLPLLLKAYKLDHITLGKIGYGGASLQDHERFYRKATPAYLFQLKPSHEYEWKTLSSDATIQEAVQYADWDIIVLQQASALSGLYYQYQPYLNRVIEHLLSSVTNPDVVFVWHMTWPYSTQCRTKAFAPYNYNPAMMYESLRQAPGTALEETGIKYVIPSGTVIHELRNSLINKDSSDFTDDGIHINHPTGQYALACTWFESIFHPIYSQRMDSIPHSTKHIVTPLDMEELQLLHDVIRNSTKISLIGKRQ